MSARSEPIEIVEIDLKTWQYTLVEWMNKFFLFFCVGITYCGNAYFDAYVFSLLRHLTPRPPSQLLCLLLVALRHLTRRPPRAALVLICALPPSCIGAGSTRSDSRRRCCCRSS